MKLLDTLDGHQLEILKYLNDPVLFMTDILGLNCEWFHQEWIHAFEKNRFMVLLAPRGHGKTFAVGSYITWKIVRDRNIRILIVTINQDKANDMMNFIQANLVSNQKLSNLFGEFKGGASWKTDQIRVKSLDSLSIPKNEPTLKVIGQGSRIISGHYNLIILDDVTDDENSRTELRRKDLESWYNGPLVGTFQPDTQVLDIGTRWHEDDFHNYLMHKSGFQTFRYKALLKEPDENGNGAKVLWPQRIPWDEKMALEYGLPKDTINLKFIKEHQGEIHFQMQYQNEIIYSGISKFKPEWIDDSINRYKKILSTPLNLKKYIGVDLGGEDTASDWGVSTVIGIDEKGDIYILDSNRSHSTSNRQIEIMKSLDDKWHASRIGMDASAQQKLLVSDAQRENPSLPIIPIKASKINDKDTRIDRLSILFETNRVYLNPELNHLIDELRLYPRSKYDDSLDSLSYALEASAEESGNVDWSRVANVITTRNIKFSKI